MEWPGEVQYRDNCRCVYCGKDLLGDFESWMSMEIDHLLPQGVEGGANADNSVTTCNVCNRLKGNWMPDEHENMTREELLAATRKYVLNRRVEWIEKYRRVVDGNYRSASVVRRELLT